MKLPDNQAKEVANHFGITTKGQLSRWLKIMSRSAAIYYFDGEGKERKIRVAKLMKLL